MKKLVFLFVSIFVLVLTAQNVKAQVNGYTLSSNEASASIIQPIGLTSTQDLDFGNIIPGASAGTVIWSADDQTRTGSNVSLDPGTPGQLAYFTVSGLSGAGYKITLPSSPITLTHSDNSETMTLSSFDSDKTDEKSTIGDGNQNFYVGATLNIGANQTEGTYIGSYDIKVQYE